MARLRLKIILLISLVTFTYADIFSQKKFEDAYRTSRKVKIDGNLNEVDWTNAEKLIGFVGFYPIFGSSPNQQTEVRVLYDDHSVYFGAVLFDNKPDSIYTELTVRDKYNGNVDYFAVSLIREYFILMC